ncbi:MAG: hypothetical protein HRT75_03985 [Gilvibacter sp.]|nr:hypothetical protein [Gilvibacter sp.]
MASTGLPWKPANQQVSGTLVDLEVNLWRDRILEIMTYDQQTYRDQQRELVSYYKGVFDTTNADTLNGIKKILK